MEKHHIIESSNIIVYTDAIHCCLVNKDGFWAVVLCDAMLFEKVPCLWEKSCLGALLCVE